MQVGSNPQLTKILFKPDKHFSHVRTCTGASARAQICHFHTPALYSGLYFGLRLHRTKQAEEKLTEFRKSEYLQKLRMCPITETHTVSPNLQFCAELLQQVFTTDNDMEYETNYAVMPFSLFDLEFALKGMRKGRCSDKDGYFLEMFLYCGKSNLQILCNHLPIYVGTFQGFLKTEVL